MLRSLLLMMLVLSGLTIFVRCAPDRHGGSQQPAPTSTAAATAAAGTVDGGGGDSSEQQISVYKIALVDYLKKHPVSDVPTDQFAAAVTSTKISLKDELQLDGQPVSAINYPDRVPREIEFSRKDLAPMMAERDRLVRLIFHEFLGILKIEHSREYQISSALNAAAIIHGVDLAAGRMVPTRLLTVDMAKEAPGFHSPMLGSSAHYQCYHLESKGDLMYSCGAAFMKTETLIGLQVLKFKCSATLLEKDLKGLGPSTSWEIPLEVSARFSALTSSVMVEWSAKFPKVSSISGTNFEITDDVFRAAVNTCKVKILLYPDDESEN